MEFKLPHNLLANTDWRWRPAPKQEGVPFGTPRAVLVCDHHNPP